MTIYERTLKCFGAHAQAIKTCEELSELIQALCKNLNHVNNDLSVCEEIADVEIMLAQLRLVYPSATIDSFVRAKTARLKAVVEEREGLL